ncbi:hypothetical protein LC55x_0232 [Lysobacter capsici]|nr:hypothetical protein LC55x_0232 [Lysobacter capsici]
MAGVIARARVALSFSERDGITRQAVLAMVTFVICDRPAADRSGGAAPGRARGSRASIKYGPHSGAR